jgi:sporulation protein YlmC with PRC-barrel domain
MRAQEAPISGRLQALIERSTQMKIWLMIGALVIPMVTTAALAQDDPEEPVGDEPVVEEPIVEEPVAEEPAMESEESAAESTEVIKTAQDQTEMRGSWIIGATVLSPDGEVVGGIEDLLIDTDDGTISGAVLSVGGFLGIGSKAIAVDWSRLTIDYDGLEITTDLSREEAELAEAYLFRDRDMPPAPPLPDTGVSLDGGGAVGGDITLQ